MEQLAFGIGENPLAAREETRAFMRESDAARGAIEQLHAELGFEAHHAFTYCRGRQAERAARRHEAAGFRRAHEGDHAGETLVVGGP